MYSPKAVLGNCSVPSGVGVEVQIVRDAFGKNLTPKRTRGKHLSSYFSKVSNETNSILGLVGASKYHSTASERNIVQVSSIFQKFTLYYFAFRKDLYQYLFFQTEGQPKSISDFTKK